MMTGRRWKLGERSYKHFRQDLKAIPLVLTYMVEENNAREIFVTYLFTPNASQSGCGLASHHRLAQSIHIATAHSFSSFFSLLHQKVHGTSHDHCSATPTAMRCHEICTDFYGSGEQSQTFPDRKFLYRRVFFNESDGREMSIDGKYLCLHSSALTGVIERTVTLRWLVWFCPTSSHNTSSSSEKTSGSYHIASLILENH